MSSLPLFNYLLPFLGAVLGMGIVFVLRPKKPLAFKLVLAFIGAFLVFGLCCSVLRKESAHSRAVRSAQVVVA